MCKYSDSANYKCPHESLKDSEYCIFHLHDDDKNIDEFNKKIKEILESKKDLIYFNGFYFPPNTDFFGINFRNTVFFSDAIFSGYVDFTAAKFSEDAGFASTQFLGDVDFTMATFSKNVNFAQSIFSENIDFTRSKFSGSADFTMSRFSGYANFTLAAFSNDAGFIHSNFLDMAKFRGTQFLHAIFSGANFFGDVDFINANFSKNADFIMATFSGDANFSYSNFSISADFTAAKFSGNADFTMNKFSGPADFSHSEFSRDANFIMVIFSKNTDFTHSEFSGDATFESVIFLGDTRFKDTRFFGETKFRNAELTGKIIFTPTKSEIIDFSKAYFSDNIRIKADMSKCSFANSNVERVDMTDSIWIVDDKPKNSYSALIEWFKNKIGISKTSIIIWEERQGKLSSNWKDLEGIYRRLKQSSQKFGDNDTAGIFYYEEMECKRKQLKGFNKFFWYFFYKKLCGYGEKPFNVIWFSGLIILASSLFFFYLGIELLGSEVLNFPPRLIDYKPSLNFHWITTNFYKIIGDWLLCLYTSVITFTTLGYGDVRPMGWSRIVASVEAGIGIIMTALFIFVFTRKMLR